MRFRLRSLFWITTVVALALVIYRAWSMDGVIGTLLGLSLEIARADDTVWATGYSGEGFRAIRKGMSRNDVYRRLGPPLDLSRYPSSGIQSPSAAGETVECWTATEHNSSYWVREIVFKGDTVVRKLSEFYVD